MLPPNLGFPQTTLTWQIKSRTVYYCRKSICSFKLPNTSMKIIPANVRYTTQPQQDSALVATCLPHTGGGIYVVLCFTNPTQYLACLLYQSLPQKPASLDFCRADPCKKHVNQLFINNGHEVKLVYLPISPVGNIECREEKNQRHFTCTPLLQTLHGCEAAYTHIMPR